MPRSGVSIPHATANVIPWEWFVRFDLAATYRYTTYAGGDLLLNIDGAPQTWVFHDMRVGALGQTTPHPLDVSWVDLANIDKVWSALAFGSTQFRDLPVFVWVVQFDPATYPQTITVLGSPKMFEGRIAGADQAEDGRLRIPINPHGAPWSKTALRMVEPKCPYDFKDSETCQYVGALTSCLRTRTDCAAHANLVHFGGADWMPDLGVELQWGSKTVSISPGFQGVSAPISDLKPPGALIGDAGNDRMPIIMVNPRGGPTDRHGSGNPDDYRRGR